MKHLSDDYFLGAEDELVDFLERQGELCISEVDQSNKLNKEYGYKLLNIHIVGIGSSFLLLTQRGFIDALSAGLIVFAAYWSVCAIYLAVGVLKLHTRGLTSAAPAILYKESYKYIDLEGYELLRSNGFAGECNRLAVLRRYRLKALSITAQELIRHNQIIGLRLTRVRIATIITPACAILITAISYFFPDFICGITNQHTVY